jgi:lambda repressor-like predicted transcriptional regulator
MAADTALDKAATRTRGEARRALLRVRRMTLADVAREADCDLSVVSRVNAAKKRSRRLEKLIARRLGLSLQYAFPEWYAERGA